MSGAGKGRLVAVILGGALAAAGCGVQTQPGTGRLNGTNSVAVVRIAGKQNGALVDALYGQLAFVISARSNDLRAVNLFATDTSQTRDYIPAPNPLNALAIPVVSDPVELAAAVRYDSISTTLKEFPSGVLPGQVRTGSLLFVRGAASFGISVVGAANVPDGLRELTNGLLLQSAGPVTAISARLTDNEQNVVLYYATFDGQDATVWERVMAHPVTTGDSFTGLFPTSLTPLASCAPGQATPAVDPNPRSLYLCPPRAVRFYQNASVSALQVLPTQPTDPNLPVFTEGIEGGRLAVALRLLMPPLNNPTLSNAGEVRIIDPALPADLDANGTSSDPFFRLVQFFPPLVVQPPVMPGTPAQPPIRQLITHARAFSTALGADGGASNVLPDGGIPVLVYEGARLFGVLDESACYGQQECAGILAVDARPGLDDGGANPNYGLLAFDDSDCLRDIDPTNPAAGQTCIFEVGGTNRMLALRLGVGLVQGVAIQAETTIATGAGLGLVPLLGVATVSGIGDGISQVFFFDAVGLRFINAASDQPGIALNLNTGLRSVFLTVNGVQSIVDGGNGGSVPFVTVKVGVGLYPQSEEISIINQGPIPTLGLVEGLPYDAGILADGGVAPVLAWPVPDAGAFAAVNVVQVNDLVLPINLSGTFCGVEISDGGPVETVFAVVQGVDDAGANIFTGPVVYVSGNTLVPIDLRLCPGAAAYSVRAGHTSQEPYLVVGSFSGLLGRMAAPDGGPEPPPIFQVPNVITDAQQKTYDRFYDPDVDAGVQIVGDSFFPPDAGPDGGVTVLPLTLELQPVSDDFFFNTDAFYSFGLNSGFLRSSLVINPSALGFAGLYLPGGVATTRVRDARGEYVLVLIAYPSANAVIDFIPDTLFPAPTPNSSAINIHF